MHSSLFRRSPALFPLATTTHIARLVLGLTVVYRTLILVLVSLFHFIIEHISVIAYQPTLLGKPMK
jgi:hypothetical protein